MKGFIKGQFCKFCGRPSEECFGRCKDCDTDALWREDENQYRCDCGHSTAMIPKYNLMNDWQLRQEPVSVGEAYRTWINGAIRGAFASGDGTFTASAMVDKYLVKYREMILEAAKMLREDMPIERKPLYRGILLEKPMENLPPYPGIEYLSFTEDKEVAAIFADFNHEMATPFRETNAKARHGHIIEHRPRPDEILFHWSWIEGKLFHVIQPNNKELATQQKEVMLLNIGRIFRLKPWRKK